MDLLLLLFFTENCLHKSPKGHSLKISLFMDPLGSSLRTREKTAARLRFYVRGLCMTKLCGLAYGYILNKITQGELFSKAYIFILVFWIIVT